MRLFLLRPNVADDAEICDIGILEDFVTVDQKQVLVPCMPPSPWKSCPISFDMPLLHLSFSASLMRCRYYWAFPVSGKMTALALPDCNVRLSVTWLMTAQSSPAGRTRGDCLLGVEGGVLIVAVGLP